MNKFQHENTAGNYFSPGAAKLADLQSKCDICQQIRKYILQGENVLMTDQAVKVFARKCGIKMNVLFYESKVNRSFVAPELMWKSIIRSVHWGDLHPRLTACIKSIQKYWAWPRMFELIEKYVKSCILCQLHKVGDNRPILKK